MFRRLLAAKLTFAFVVLFVGEACLGDVPRPAPPLAPAPRDPMPLLSAPKREAAAPRESAHDLFISALVCFGAPLYTDAVGVERSDATATIERACAPAQKALAGPGRDFEDDDASVAAVHRAVEDRAQNLRPSEREELLQLFDKGLAAIREARSPVGLAAWKELAAFAETLASPVLKDEADALVTLIEADRRLRREMRDPPEARELVDLEERLVELSRRLGPSDLRTALDGFVERIRTML